MKAKFLNAIILMSFCWRSITFNNSVKISFLKKKKI